MENHFNYKNHLSKSLEKYWKFKDFRVYKVIPLNESDLEIVFEPKYRILFWILYQIYNKDIPLSGYSSVLLVFRSSIIGAGYCLKKESKDGEVIVRDIDIEYLKPIFYNYKSRISVCLKTRLLKETSKYVLYRTTFSIGKDKEHIGSTKLFYCSPKLKQFSYL